MSKEILLIKFVRRHGEVFYLPSVVSGSINLIITIKNKKNEHHSTNVKNDI